MRRRDRKVREPLLNREPDEIRFDALVNKMTNHERHQWAKAGYPGLRGRVSDKLGSYADAAARRLDGVGLML